MSLDEQVTVANDAGTRKRVRMAAVVAGLAVAGEAIGPMPQSAFDKRQALALRVLTTGGQGTPEDDIIRMFVWAVAANPAITIESDDGSIQFAVNSVWSDLAGVTGTEMTLALRGEVLTAMAQRTDEIAAGNLVPAAE